jgi:nucleoside-diphosphate-sugar epimerase
MDFVWWRYARICLYEYRIVKILLCGNNSFAAKGLYDKLQNAGLQVDCFTRGEDSLIGNTVTGNVFQLAENENLALSYDIVINFIIIKNETIEENLRYIKSLDRFCKERSVKRLIHISSTSVYPNDLKFVNEESEIETDPERKGGYASIKVAVDQYLLNHKLSYDLVFIRPGFIVSPEQKSSITGIGILLPLNFILLLGDKKSSLPIIDRDLFHEAVVRITLKENPEKVYLILENSNGTKYKFLRRQNKKIIVSMPKKVATFSAEVAKRLRVISMKQFLQVLGLFKNTCYDSSASECNLNYSFVKDSICVIGAGAYGSYLINTLCEKYPTAQIILFDVGDSKIKSEKEIGYKSNILKSAYAGLSKGRFFGFGGATAKWGGQLLTFSKNDFQSPNQYLSDIIFINEKYKEDILKRFGIKNTFIEKHLNDNLYIKTGIWLSYFSRNLFYYFKISKKKNVQIIENARVIKIQTEGKRVLGIEFLKDGVFKKVTFNHYFLTAGAFESNRILLNSGLMNTDKCSFSDHLSQKVFKIKNSTIIGTEDYAFAVNGASLVTKRIIGEIDGVSFYANPIFNSEFPFFQNLKQILFKYDFSLSLLRNILVDVPNVIAFSWSILVKKKIYVYKNEWYLYIDIENPSTSSFIKLSSDTDAFDQAALDVNFTLSEKASYTYEKAKEIIKEYLKINEVTFEECSDKIHVEKSEDTYHPYGMMCEFNSIEDYFKYFQNMLVINTGILPRAGGINTTAVGFPLIEEYISNYLDL